MKHPINKSTYPIKSPNKKATINPITKYFLTNKPTSTQHCSKTTNSLKKLKTLQKIPYANLKSVSQT